VFYTLLSIVTLLVPCFAKNYPTEYCKTPCEIWTDNKISFVVIVLIGLLRILLLFLFLRPICGSI